MCVCVCEENKNELRAEINWDWLWIFGGVGKKKTGQISDKYDWKLSKQTNN